jgi:hypothetical protein
MFRSSRLPATSRSRIAIAGLFVLGLAASSARAQDATPYVTLENRWVLPADTFAPGPPSGFAITGNTNGRQVPFASQPVQGVSGVLPKWNGNLLVLADNGFGAKGNSADFRLRWYEVAPAGSGTVTVAGYSELYDPQRLVPFPIVNGNLDRVLTGGDFDPESFRQAPDGTFWFGEEFGPFLLHTDATGRLLDPPFPMPVPPALQAFARGRPYIQSPDNPDFASLPTAEERRAAANLGSSRGFEGMALNTSATKLYPLLEGALLDDPIRTRLLIQEFDLATKQYTGNIWFYPLSDPAHAIGDMTALSDSTFLVIERDNNQGEAAAFKRIYIVDLGDRAEDGTLTKRLVVDLMSITDARGLTTPEAGAVGLGPVFSFPFVTIESVYPVDAQTLVVVNDNNYPFSSGRRPGTDADDTEIILLRLPQPLDRASTLCGGRPDCSAP